MACATSATQHWAMGKGASHQDLEPLATHLSSEYAPLTSLGQKARSQAAQAGGLGLSEMDWIGRQIVWLQWLLLQLWQLVHTHTKQVVAKIRMK